MSNLYAAYGLTISSELPLPELIPAQDGTPELRIWFGAIERLPDEVGRQGDFVRAGVAEAVLFWDAVAAFHIRQGREIIVEPHPGVDGNLLRSFLLGSAVGVALDQRGLLTLHASAVEIDGCAVAFIGWKGFGKSTTAAALHARGHRLLTDDILALDLAGDAPVIYPGFAQLKLRPDAASSVVAQPELLPRLHPEIDKLAHRPTAGFSLDPLPLRGIFLLDQGERPEVTPLRPHETFFALVCHSYAQRFLKAPSATAAHFRQCERLAASVPVQRLRRPYRLEGLPDVLDLVETHVAHQFALA